MKRQYSNEASESADFFIGTEVEHSPAYGLKTLFVVGVQPVDKILKILSDPFTEVGGQIEHIYFGANQSFPLLDTNDQLNWALWESMIEDLLEKGYKCTLDLDVSCIEGLAESSLCEYHNFIPMVSVKLPYIQLLGYNATIKLDDTGFAKSNPGVWCHKLHDLLKRETFTDWSKYNKDTVIK